jgi:hypothetical protein
MLVFLSLSELRQEEAETRLEELASSIVSGNFYQGLLYWQCEAVLGWLAGDRARSLVALESLPHSTPTFARAGRISLLCSRIAATLGAQEHVSANLIEEALTGLDQHGVRGNLHVYLAVLLDALMKARRNSDAVRVARRFASKLASRNMIAAPVLERACQLCEQCNSS